MSASPTAPAPEPSISGVIDASPNPCVPGLTGMCSTTISWHATVVSGTARVFVQQGDGALIVADNMIYPERARRYADVYRERVRNAADMTSVLLPVGSGIELSRFR